jgi:hypothetical protein
MLALGFALLYRKGNPVASAARAESKESAADTTKASSHARGRG